MVAPEDKKSNCYRCGKKLTEADLSYTHGKYWCKTCRKAYDIERRLKNKTIEEIRQSIAQQLRVTKVYKNILEERILLETRQRRKEANQ